MIKFSSVHLIICATWTSINSSRSIEDGITISLVVAWIGCPRQYRDWHWCCYSYHQYQNQSWDFILWSNLGLPSSFRPINTFMWLHQGEDEHAQECLNYVWIIIYQNPHCITNVVPKKKMCPVVPYITLIWLQIPFKDPSNEQNCSEQVESAQLSECIPF